MNFPMTTFKHVKIYFTDDTFREFDNCQMIITGDYLIINNEPTRPNEKTKKVESEVFPMGTIESYTTTTALPEDYKGLITD